MKKVTEAVVEDATRVIASEELAILNEKVTAINKAQMQIGGLEAHKHELLHALVGLGAELKEIQSKLESEYGSVSVDLVTGEISDVANNT